MRYSKLFIAALFTAAVLSLVSCQPKDPSKPDLTGEKGIASVADMMDFAAAVNAGESLEKWQGEDGGIVLLADLDFSEVTSWTPIGYCHAPMTSYIPEIKGNAFTGKFDGGGHTIRNLKMVADGSRSGMHYGLFGTLGPGAAVQNFTIDASCSLEVTGTASFASGVIAGLVYDATVRDITSYASMTFEGKAGVNPMYMALIGYLFSDSAGTTVDSVHNHGEISAKDTDNLSSGATCYHIAGIAGFSHAQSTASPYNTVSSCNNYGKMGSATARTAGIIAAANRRTQIVNCENHGNQINTMSKTDGGRLGMILCFGQNDCVVTGCVNHGNLTSTTSGRCGGIISLPNKVVFENCENYGTVLTDSQYRGLFWGYTSEVSSWTNCKCSGKLGVWNKGTAEYDLYSDAAKASYLGRVGSNPQTLSGITDEVDLKDPSLDEDDGAEFNMLFIGNSFTMDAVTHLPGICYAAGLKKIKMTHYYYGGQTLQNYNRDWDVSTGYTVYESPVGGNSFKNTNSTTKFLTLHEISASREWDVVTLQEHTGRREGWEWTTAEKTAILQLIEKITATQKKAPKFYYIMSQAYYNMDKIGSAQKPTPFTTQAEMFEVITTQAKKVMAECPFDGLLPTGTMFQNLRTSPINVDNGMDLTRDGYHMDNGITRYGAACVLYLSLVAPRYPAAPDLSKNTYRYSTSNTSTSAYCTPVTDANAPYAQQAARYAIEKPYEVTSMK